MEIIILAGGLGKRLRPLSEDIPKCMVPVNGRPLLDYQLEWISKFDIGKPVIACGYKWENIKSHYGNRLIYSVEDEPLGTAGALRLALEHVDGEDFIVLNADDVTNIGFDDFARMGSNTTAVAHFHSNFGLVEIDDDRIVLFREKPLLPYWANCGLHILSKTLKLPERGSLESDVLPPLAKQGKLKAYLHSGFWKTVNTMKDLEDIEAFFRERKI